MWLSASVHGENVIGQVMFFMWLSASVHGEHVIGQVVFF